MFFLSSYDHFQRKLIIIAKSQGFFPWLFSLSWEQRKFSELYEKVSRKNDLTYGKDDIISVANMYFKPDSYITEDSYLLTYNVFELGDIAFEGNKSKNFAHGRFVENTIGNGIVSHVFDVFRPIMKEYDLQFWKYAINNERIMGSVLVRCTKASTMMTNLVASDFLNESVLVPSYDEQKKIGAFLLSLDDLITLHQRKGNQREKKSLDFAWEQRKLGDCFSERVESMPDGELISVTINDGIKKFSELGRHDNSNEDKSKYKKVCVGDIAYNSMRMWQGASGYSPYEGIVSPAYTVLTPNSGIISKCLAYQFKLPEMTHTFQIHSQGITSDNWNLKYPTLSEIKIFVSPDEKEQEQIARFFTNLDDLITLHQREHKSNFRRKTNVKQSTRDRPFLLLLCSVDKGLQRGSGP